MGMKLKNLLADSKLWFMTQNYLTLYLAVLLVAAVAQLGTVNCQKVEIKNLERKKNRIDSQRQMWTDYNSEQIERAVCDKKNETISVKRWNCVFKTNFALICS